MLAQANRYQVRYIPESLNFSKSLQHARKWGWAIKNLHDIPFSAIKKEFVRLHTVSPKTLLTPTKDQGTANPSFAYSLLARYRENEEAGAPNQLTLQDIQGASGAVFIAGSNTVSSHSFVTVTKVPRYDC